MSPRGRRSARWPYPVILQATAWLTALAAGSLVSCRRDVSLLQPSQPSDGPFDGSGDGPLSDRVSQRTSDAAVTPPACQGSGDPVRFMTATGFTCGATLAARAHRTALCSCSDWTVAQMVSVYNSPMFPNGVTTPAAIGVNGGLTSTNDLSVPGAVYASGAKGISVTGQFNNLGSLRSGGPITFTGPAQASVGGDAYAAGDVIGPAKIGGALHLPANALAGAATMAAATVREPVIVAPPCDCSSPFDVAAAIAAVMATNDDAALGISPDRLANVTIATTLDIPCGVYALSSISAQASLTLNIHGRVLMVVTGDVLLQRSFTVMFDQSAPNAELDLLLQGSLTANTPFSFPVGTANGPLLRIWMKGPGPIAFPTTSPLVGAIIHAPNAPLMAPRGLLVIGSITAASLSIGGPFSITYDDAVLTGGMECGDPKVDPLP